MAAALSSSTATARMTVEGAPAWDLATLMPDGAVGASASDGRAVALAQAFADEHRGLTVAETASVFGEALTCAHLLGLAEDPAIRFELLARLGEHWMAVNRELYGGSLELIDRDLDEARDAAAVMAA